MIELLSPSNSLKYLHKKMLEYQENGVILGFLANFTSRQLEIYRIGQPVEILDN